MILQNAAIHYYFQTGRTSPCRGFLVYNSQLHPDYASLTANGGVDDIRNELRTPENIHNVDWFRYGIQIRVALLPQNFGLQRDAGAFLESEHSLIG